MSTSVPPSSESTPWQHRVGGPSVAWGISLDFGLVGRGDELVRVQVLLDDARSGVTGSLVVEGEPGIGKSTLLQAAERRAIGFRCVRVRGAESERVLAHAGLLQALGPLRGRLADVPEAQREALTGALGWGPASSVSAEPFLVGAAVLSLLAAEAESNPVLVLVDDVQWVDRESSAALVFAARRLQEDAVAFVWSGRAGTLPADLLHGLPAIALHGLTPAEAGQLLADRLSPPVAARLADDTAGNPLALLEIAARLNDAQRVGAAPLPERLPVGDRLGAVYEELLSGLSAPAWRAVLLCALNRSASMTAVTTALGGEGVNAAAALDEAVDADILVPDGPTLVFRHPLLRASALAVATSAQQRRAHLSLAEAHSDDPHSLARGWHRAEASTGPDPALAEELIGLADQSRARQGHAAASAALERAALLTGSPEKAAELLAAAASDAFLAGDIERTKALTSLVLNGYGRPRTRGKVLFTLGRLEHYAGSVPRATEVLTSAVELITGGPLIRALAELAMARFRLGDMAGLADCAAKMTEAGDPHDPEQRMLTDFVRAVAASVSGDPTTCQTLMTDVVAQIAEPPLRDDPQSLIFLALAGGFLNNPRDVFPLGEHLLAQVRDRGAFGVLVPSLSLTAYGRAWLGDHAGAFADAGEAAELAEQLGYAADASNAAEMLAWQSAARGLHDDARAALALARQLTDRAGTTAHATHLAVTAAFCAMCRGDTDEAASLLEARLAADGGVGTMGEPLGIAPDLIETYVALGRRADAAELVARYAAVTPSPTPPPIQALVARCQGLVANDDDDDVAVRAFEQALAAHTEAPVSFEAARTQLLYGARLRRSGQRVRAREQLQSAHDAFAAMDLGAWVVRAAEELAATGARARRREITADEPLTSQETRVALKAAKGQSNKEIAAALFISPKTVERHLSSVYRKRRFRSRTELAAAFRSP